MSGESESVSISVNTSLQQFEAEVDGHRAVLEYYLQENVIVFTHTGVPEPISGKGIGTALVEAALRHARNERVAIVPLCPFVEEYLRKHSEDLDLVEPNYRRQRFPDAAPGHSTA